MNNGNNINKIVSNSSFDKTSFSSELNPTYISVPSDTIDFDIDDYKVEKKSNVSPAEKTGATITNGVFSLFEGALGIVEAVGDTATIVGATITTPIAAIYDTGKGVYKAIDNNKNVFTSIKEEFTSVKSLTETIWQDTKAMVSQECCKSMFDDFYDKTAVGSWTKNNAYGYQNVRNVGQGIGYVGGIVAISVATYGAGTVAFGASATTGGLSATMGGVAATAGWGKGSEEAWIDGASVTGGLEYGVANAALEGTEFLVGGQINGLVVGGNSLINSGVRVALDSATGATDAASRPLIRTIYRDESYKELFEQAGGWKSVGTQAALAGGMSAAAEASGLAKKYRYEKEKISNISNNTSINGSSFEKINVKDLEPSTTNADAGILLNKKGFQPKDLYASYSGYDNVYNANDVSAAIEDAIVNGNGRKNLIVIKDINKLSKEMIDNLPDNTNIRVLGGYTDEYLGNLKTGGSGTATLEHVTYNKAELNGILSEMKKFDAGINPDWTDMQKAKYAYDYLNNNVKYNAKPGFSLDRSKEMDGLMSLVKGESTCQGFAETYKSLLDRMGIDCTTIGGSLNHEGQHAYTIVSINNKSFIVDPVKSKLKISEGISGFNPDPSEYFARNNIELLDSVKKANIDKIAQTHFAKLSDITLDYSKATAEDAAYILSYYNNSDFVIDGVGYHYKVSPIEAACLNERFKQLTGYDHPTYLKEQVKVLDEYINSDLAISVNGQPSIYQRLKNNITGEGPGIDIISTSKGTYLEKMEKNKFDTAKASLEDVTDILNHYGEETVILNGTVYHTQANVLEGASYNARYKELTGHDHPTFVKVQNELLDREIKNNPIRVNDRPSVYEQLKNNTLEIGNSDHVLRKQSSILLHPEESSLEDVSSLLNYYDSDPVLIDGIIHHTFNDPDSAAKLNARYKELTGYDHPKYYEKVTSKSMNK